MAAVGVEHASESAMHMRVLFNFARIEHFKFGYAIMTGEMLGILG